MKVGHLTLDRRDTVFSVLFVLLGVTSCYYGLTSLKFTGQFGMGPGFFPVIVSAIMVVLAAMVGVGAIGREGSPSTLIRLRPFVLVVASPIAFGLTIRPFGLAIAILLSVSIAALANRRITLVQTIVLSLAVTALCVGLFHYLLSLPVPLLGYVFG
jgi:hypothetical protein